nr:immunoglobulin heavy chain junction region [Mus musculus]
CARGGIYYGNGSWFAYW